MASWNLQAFFAPQAFDLLVIDRPAFDLQECSNFTVPIAAILLGQANEGEPQGILILGFPFRTIPLGTAGLVQYLAGATFTAAQALAYMNDRIPYLLWA